MQQCITTALDILFFGTDVISENITFTLNVIWQKVSPDKKIMIQLQLAPSVLDTNDVYVICNTTDWCMNVLNWNKQKNCNNSLSCEKQVFVLFVYTVWPLSRDFCTQGQKSAKQWLKYFKITFLHWLASGDSHLPISAKM